MKKTAITFLLLIASIGLFSQDFEVPEDYVLDKEKDYAQYEQDVIDGVNWLLKTPVTKEKAKRKEVNAFILKWIIGSPSVSIEINEGIVTFMKCSDCLLMFMGGWTKYALEAEDDIDTMHGTIAGIECAIEFYKKNKSSLGKNKAIEKYIKLQEKNELEEYLESHM